MAKNIQLVTETYQAMRPMILQEIAAWMGSPRPGAGAGSSLAAHTLSGPWHTGALLETQAPWAATKLEWATALASHAALPDVHHARQHNIVGSDHVAGGLTVGHVLRANGETSFGFGWLQHNEIAGITADQHHNQQHNIVGADHVVVGNRWQIVGVTATDTVGLITPVSSTLSVPEGILKSDGAGGVYLRQLGIGTNSPARKFHIMDNTGAQMRLGYNDANYMDFLVDAGGSWRIAPTGDIIVDPQSDDMRPLNNYDVNLGLPIKKFLSIHAAEAWFDTLVASEVRSTIGGKVWVAPTTELTRDLSSAATTIYVKYNNLSNGDRVLMEARGRFEAMAITSTYTTITAGAEYSYTVQRDLDGTGANDWIAGDALVNTGQTGLGWIELYAQYGFPHAGQTATQRVGPTIVGNVRKSATFNDFREHWAVGNLNGLYDFSGNQYGAAFGDPTQTWISLDDRAAGLGGGLRFMNGLAEVGFIRNNGLWRFNGDANNYIQWDGSALRVRGDIVVQGAPGWGNVAGGINLVRNSSFELDSNGDGLADGFSIYNNDGGAVPTTASRVASSKSTWAQRISWTGMNASTKGIYFDVTSLKRWEVPYVLTFWARTNTPVTIDFYENSPNATTKDYLIWPWANTAWQFYALRLMWTPGGGYSNPAANFYLSIANAAPVANGWIEFDNVQVVEGSEIVPYTSSPVDIVGFGGNINMPLAVSGAGLYMSASTLGYWSGSAWIAYMNNAGQFGLNSGGANYLVWDGSTLTIAGNINVVGGNAATQTYAAGQAATAQSNAVGYTNTVASGKADTNLANSVLSTLISGANIRVGSGVKDSNLNGWNIDVTEIVGQAGGVDQVVLDGTGRIIAGGSMVKIDGNGIDIVRGAGSQVNRLNFVTSLAGEVAARISCYTDSSAILPYYNHNVLILAPLATAGKAGRLTLVQSDLWVDGSLGAWNNLSFGSGWTNYGSGYQTCQYRRFGDRVHLRGLASNTSTGATIGTLPVGYRPTAGRLILNLQADPSGAPVNTAYRVDIDTSGNILAMGWTPANGDWVSLDCSFSIS